MIQKMTALLFLLGLFSRTSCYFILIQEPKTWTEAQSFCQEFHADLAPVQTDQDRSEIQEIASSMSFNRSWMGLYYEGSSWCWSFQLQSLQYKSWGWFEPTDMDHRLCVTIHFDGFWYTDYCEEQKTFFCYTGRDSGGKFVVIKTTMTWRDARQYCRKNYIDLATISDDNDNYIVYKLIRDYFGYFAFGFEGWIGLSRNLWLWSDQSTFNWMSLKWAPGEPDYGSGYKRCAFVEKTGLITNEECSQRLSFICAKHRRKQLVRVALTSAGHLNESAVMAAVEKKIQQILTEQKMDAGSNITWQVQPDGKIFHKKPDSGMKKDSPLPFCPNVNPYP